MDIQHIMRVVDASFAARQSIEKALREIDRRALNAMVLVKRHGNALAGYGVVAQAFRERAAILKTSASHLQESIAPLIEAYMRILQHQRFAQSFQEMLSDSPLHGKACPNLISTQNTWQKIIQQEEVEAVKVLDHLLETVQQLQEGIEEQEYVVTNGRIEAALAEKTGAPLMRVSRDMGEAVRTVAQAIRSYRHQLESLEHESSTRL
ncbi:hypothetical protein HF670_02170 [Acidithiobacillus thiooxidans]|jgi:predicted translin family RNA/ssDNA-binding protein|uniref:Chemotaxis protein n=1 Tax=Acidithiobacillus thiooxidans ATCC 19377 TaxID=637390 RepID=A0A543Q7N6_ACITH|nr:MULTISPECIES: hypothetical protein [Acidithiobacillus]MBE7565563.1 hypothetical protein [Acidithiobacillus sp. HP-11]MBU2749499.1 hypothetical protein [Acidithiobacillus thiooxidans]MBU2794943.1 hypothetical protein [Acidithiobacillus thiooxidans]MBU2838390.1 hypothetical protein [Acidithiobacillus thiooxidans]MDX5936136.1 hypothetical protein [Acidithiobacillus thiooxidans]